MKNIQKSDFFEVGKDGVKRILTPDDKKIDIVEFEDSSAGVVSIKLAGFSCCGISGGNIEKAGIGELCDYKIDNLMKMLDIIL